jgi:hypothetical protein
MRLYHLSPMRALPSLSLVVFSMAVSLDADGRIEFEDSVARSRYEYLIKRSATMREMVSVIDTTPDVLVRIRARPGLQDSFPHPAHGILRVDGDRVQALLEFDTLHNRLFVQLEMLAHELAHVIEAVCLPRISAQKGIRAGLLARGFSMGQSRWGRIGIETPFAMDVGHQVLVEVMRRAKDLGRLHGISRRHELAVSCSDVEPPAVPAATPGSR